MDCPIDQSGVPILSVEDLELKAEEVIRHFKPQVLKHPGVTPIAEFIIESVTQFGLKFSHSKVLSTTTDGARVLGRFRFNPMTIEIDHDLFYSSDDTRLEFTFAHEFGHFVLHREIEVERSDYVLEDTEAEILSKRRSREPRTARDWMEWHARRFAASILVPKATLKKAVFKAQWDLGIRRNLGKVYLSSSTSSRRDLNDLLSSLCSCYGVSQTTMRVRLRECELLIDRTSRLSRLGSATC